MFEAVLRSRWSDSTIMAATTNQPRPLACHSGTVKMAACSKMSEREKEERRPLLWAKARSTELRLGWHANSDWDDYFWCFCLSEYNVESEEAQTGSWQWNQWKVILFCQRFIQKTAAHDATQAEFARISHKISLYAPPKWLSAKYSHRSSEIHNNDAKYIFPGPVRPLIL